MKKKYILFIAIIVGIVYLALYDFFGSVSESVALYFYSAILQGNTAIITLTAMFLIFKRQILDAMQAKIEEIIIDYLTKSVNVCINYSEVSSLEKMSDDMISRLDDKSKNKIRENEQSAVWKTRFAELKMIKLQKSNLWNIAKFPFFGLSFILIASVILLSLSSYIHNYGKTEVFLLGLVVALESIFLYLLFRFIKLVSAD